MQYTVKQIADLAGVSIRTLRFYDKIGLLKPAYYGDNGYRYYKKQQLLALQQILFFRELDFLLKEIKACLTNPLVKNIQILQLHKIGLEKKMLRIQ